MTEARGGHTTPTSTCGEFARRTHLPLTEQVPRVRRVPRLGPFSQPLPTAGLRGVAAARQAARPAEKAPAAPVRPHESFVPPGRNL